VPKLGFFVGIAALVAAVGASPHEKRGGLVLQFDDGWQEWVSIIAPELARVGGKATAFVNNQNIPKRLTFEDLRRLQNEYEWEIGTHTYHHKRAPWYVQHYGLSNWLKDEVDLSIGELEAAGLNVRSLVFPFNAHTPELTQAVMTRVSSYRRAAPFAITKEVAPDGAVPGTAFDLTAFVPLKLLREWIDTAAERGDLLFLFGHRVLDDSEFIFGKVVSVGPHELILDSPFSGRIGSEWILVPDMSRRYVEAEPVRVLEIREQSVVVSDSIDLRRLTAPGAQCIIGPAYGYPLSMFREMIQYAAERLNFFTVSEIVAGKHRSASAGSGSE